MKKGKLTKILGIITAVFLSIGTIMVFQKPVYAKAAGISAEDFVGLFEKTAGSDWGTNTCKTEYAELPSDMLFTGAGLQVSVGKQTVTGRLYNTTGVENISQNGITFKNGVDLGDNVWNGGNGISGTNASTFTYTPAITLAFPGTASDRSDVLGSNGWRSQFNDFIVRFEDSADSSKWIDVLISSWNWGRSCGYATRFSNGVSERDSQFFATNADSRDGKLRSFLCCNEDGKRGAVMDVQSPNMSGMNSLSEAPISLCYVENDGIYAVSGNYWVLIRAFNQGTNAENLISVPFNGFSDSSNVKISVFGKSVNDGTYGNSITGDCAVYTIMGIDGVEFTKNADGTVNAGEATYEIEVNGNAVYRDGDKVNLSVVQKSFFTTETISSGSIVVKFNGKTVDTITAVKASNEYTLSKGYGVYEFVWSDGTNTASKKVVTDLSCYFEKTSGSVWGNNSSFEYAQLPNGMKYAGAGLQVSVDKTNYDNRMFNSTSISETPKNGLSFKNTIDLSDNGNVWNGGNGVSGTGAKTFAYTPFITLAFPGTVADRAAGAYGSDGSIRQQFTDMVVRLEDATDPTKRIDIALGFWKWSSSMGLGASFSNGTQADVKFFGTNATSRDGALRIRQVADENTPYDRGVPLLCKGNFDSDAPISLCYVAGDGIYAVSGDNWTLVRGFKQVKHADENPVAFNGFGDASKVKLSVFGYAVNKETDDAKLQGDQAIYTIMNIDGVELSQNADGTVNAGEAKYSLEVKSNETVREGETVKLLVNAKNLFGTTAYTGGSVTVKLNGTTVDTITELTEETAYTLNGYGEYEFVWSQDGNTASATKAVVSKLYTLTYNYNYEGIADEKQTFDNTDMSELTIKDIDADKVPKGKKFLGWFTDKVNGEKVTAITELKDIIVYAHWGSAKYTVSFFADDVLLGNTYEADYGEKLLEKVGTLPAIPEKEGYTKTAPYFAYNGVKIDENTVVEGDMTIVAVYTPDEYEVVVTDGSKQISVATVKYGESLAIKKIDLNKEGCTILSVKANGETLVYKNEEYVLETVTANTEIIVLYGLDNFNYDGAAIRLKRENDETGNGIRFTVSLPKAQYEQILAADPNAQFGTLLIPADLVKGDLTVNTNLVSKAIANERMNEKTVDGVEYVYWVAYLWNIAEKNYSREIAARGYIEYSGNVVYTVVSEDRSLSRVAQLCTADDNASQVVKDAVADYLPKVVFDLNGATGSVNEVVLKDGVSYTLPAVETLNVTAPEGEDFAGYEISGKTYNAGDVVTISGKVTVKTLWRNAQ